MFNSNIGIQEFSSTLSLDDDSWFSYSRKGNKTEQNANILLAYLTWAPFTCMWYDIKLKFFWCFSNIDCLHFIAYCRGLIFPCLLYWHSYLPGVSRYSGRSRQTWQFVIVYHIWPVVPNIAQIKSWQNLQFWCGLKYELIYYCLLPTALEMFQMLSFSIFCTDISIFIFFPWNKCLIYLCESALSYSSYNENL